MISVSSPIWDRPAMTWGPSIQDCPGIASAPLIKCPGFSFGIDKGIPDWYEDSDGPWVVDGRRRVVVLVVTDQSGCRLWWDTQKVLRVLAIFCHFKVNTLLTCNSDHLCRPNHQLVSNIPSKLQQSKSTPTHADNVCCQVQNLEKTQCIDYHLGGHHLWPPFCHQLHVGMMSSWWI